MSESTETAVDAFPEQLQITIGSTGTAVILSLAIYGAGELTQRTIGIAKKIRRNRKARKALKTEQSTE